MILHLPLDEFEIYEEQKKTRSAQTGCEGSIEEG